MTDSVSPMAEWTRRLRELINERYASCTIFLEREDPSLVEDDEIKLPIDPALAVSFFGEIHKFPRVEEREENDDPLENEEKVKAVSTVESYRSAIVWFYKKKNQRLEEELDVAISNFLDGYKRLVADLKQKGIMSIEEGKQPLSFSGYSFVARKLLRLPSSRGESYVCMLYGKMFKTIYVGSFAWTFLVLTWNLMARSNSTSLIKLKHVCWRDDALIITLPQHKGDKTGKHTYGRHVYANPLQPEICPITALAVLIFSKQHHYAGGRQDLFEGGNQEKRYAQILSSVINGFDAGFSSY